jgi:alkylhydroperoxidase family enzyme
MARAALGEALIQAVFDDWRTAPVSAGLRAMLGVVEMLTLRPDEIMSADIDAIRAAGISDLQIEQAIHICGAFNMIVRIADTLDFEVPDVSPESGYGVAALSRGYM